MREFIHNQVLPFLGWLLINFVVRTSRIKVINEEMVNQLKQQGKNIIYALWHGRMFLPIWILRKQNIQVVVSPSRDGEYLHRIISKFGYQSVRGSTSKNPSRTLVQILNKLNQGKDIEIAPDGPQGPSHKVQPGIIWLARKSGMPIIPLTFAARRKKFFSSWDKFLFPFPFNKLVFIYGNPIYVSPADEIETKARKLEEKLNQITDQADLLCSPHPALSPKGRGF